jgi:hypothetical protein
MFTKKQIGIGAGVVTVIVVIILIAIFKKESFISKNDEDENERKEVRENFPTGAMNVLYADASGNLSSTTDLGVQNLTTAGRAQFQDGVVIGQADLSGPDGKTWITNEGITFGGTNGSNKDREGNSAQISAGKHDANALCIVGMSDTNKANRRVHMWAEGGTTHEGPINVNGPINLSSTVSGNCTISVNSDRNEGGRISIRNGWKGAAGKTKDWSIWNMTGPYGNKLSFWRYNGDGANVGPALDIYDDGNVNVPGGSLGVSGSVSASGNINTSGKIQEGGNALVPRGTIVMWNGAANTIPGGWALCNGAGGTPDLRDRFIVGAGSSYAYGATGGATHVTLSINEIPSHSHSYDGMNGGHWRCDNDNEQRCSPDGYAGTTGATGGGAAHENRPPYYALCYIMKL